MAKLSDLFLYFLTGVVIGSPVSQQHGNSLDKWPFPPVTPSKGTQMSDDDWLLYIQDLKEKHILFRFWGESIATEASVALARALGASATEPGAMTEVLKTDVNKGFGLVPERAGANIPPKIQYSKSRTTIPGAKAVKIRHGPYLVPNMMTKNGQGDEGMLSNWPDEKVTKPCEGDCTIIAMSAGLEYENGTNANVDNGMWLHHMVLYNVGPGRQEETCKDREISAAHASAGATSRTSERIFASGNERTIVNFQDLGYNNTGYKIQSTDRFNVLLELMNINMDHKLMYLTMTYDIIEGHPFKEEVRPVWLDVRNCGSSEYNPPDGTNKFSFETPWTSTVNGELMGIWGHLHDGGSNLKIEVDGQEICDNVAKYGTLPGYVEPAMNGQKMKGDDHGHMRATKHLSEIDSCLKSRLKLKQIRAGQKWKQIGVYDFDKNRGMTAEFGNRTVWDEVMGISILYVRKTT